MVFQCVGILRVDGGGGGGGVGDGGSGWHISIRTKFIVWKYPIPLFPCLDMTSIIITIIYSELNKISLDACNNTLTYGFRRRLEQL